MKSSRRPCNTWPSWETRPIWSISPAARQDLAHAIRLLRSNGIFLSDRRVVKTQRLVAAAAVLDGRAEADARDLWPLLFAVPTPAEQALARDVLRDLLDHSQSAGVPHAATEASLSPKAQAELLLARGHELFSKRPDAGTEADARAHTAWCLRLEGLGREIDATLHPAQQPDALQALRDRLGCELTEREPEVDREPNSGHASEQATEAAPSAVR